MAAFRFLKMHPAMTALIVVVVAGAAFAADRIIRISTDGKSASQIESEIQGALASEGFGDAEVSVTDAGEGRREVKIGIERGGTATLVVDVAKDGSAASVEIPNADSLDDYALERAIQAELDRAGLDLRVTVSGGRIDIQ